MLQKFRCYKIPSATDSECYYCTLISSWGTIISICSSMSCFSFLWPLRNLPSQVTKGWDKKLAFLDLIFRRMQHIVFKSKLPRKHNNRCLFLVTQINSVLKVLRPLLDRIRIKETSNGIPDSRNAINRYGSQKKHSRSAGTIIPRLVRLDILRVWVLQKTLRFGFWISTGPGPPSLVLPNCPLRSRTLWRILSGVTKNRHGSLPA